MILRIKFYKKNYLKYISHLDLLRLFERTFRLINLPVEYSYGYNPRPRFSFASPLPLGTEGYGEYMEVSLLEKVNKDEFIESMNSELPKDIQIISCQYTDDRKAIGHYIHWADYNLNFFIKEDLTRREMEDLIDRFLELDEVFILKEKKKRYKLIKWQENIVPLVDSMDLQAAENREVTMNVRLKSGEGNLRPEDFLEAFLSSSGLNLDDRGLRIKRLELLGEDNGIIYSIF